MITITKKALILTADSKAYSFDGRSGTSYKIRVLIDGFTYPLKATQEQVDLAQKYLQKSVDLTFQISAPKENVRMDFLSIDEKK